MKVIGTHAIVTAIVSASVLAAQPAGDPCTVPATKAGTGRWQDELRCTKTLRVEAGSKFFNADALMRELLKSKDFQDLGYQAVKHTSEPSRRKPGSLGIPNEMLLRVTRKRFTTRFTIALVSPATDRIYVSEEASSLGGDIEPDLAKSVLKWIREANGRTTEKK
jgi:hypothetical protein